MGIKVSDITQEGFYLNSFLGTIGLGAFDSELMRYPDDEGFSLRLWLKFPDPLGAAPLNEIMKIIRDSIKEGAIFHNAVKAKDEEIINLKHEIESLKEKEKRRDSAIQEAANSFRDCQDLIAKLEDPRWKITTKS